MPVVEMRLVLRNQKELAGFAQKRIYGLMVQRRCWEGSLRGLRRLMYRFAEGKGDWVC